MSLSERLLGTGPGLALLFSQMTRRFVPERAGGLTGDVQYDLTLADGSVRSWTVTIGADAASSHQGPSPEPRLVLKLTLADFLAIAKRDLSAAEAVIRGRLDIRGDLAMAMRLGEMFGRSQMM